MDLFTYWANPMFKCEGFNQSQEFCVLVAVMPKILYHSEEVMYLQGPGNAKTEERANQCDHHGNLVQSWAGWQEQGQE